MRPHAALLAALVLSSCHCREKHDPATRVPVLVVQDFESRVSVKRWPKEGPGKAEPSEAWSVSKRPVARGNEPMARFHPAFVLTRAQPSMRAQLRTVHGTTGTSVSTHASTAASGRESFLKRPSSGGSGTSARNGAHRSVCGRTSTPSPRTSDAPTKERKDERRVATQNPRSVRSAASGSVMTSAE